MRGPDAPTRRAPREGDEVLGRTRGVAAEGLGDGACLETAQTGEVLLARALVETRDAVERIAHVGGDGVAHAREHHHRDERVRSEGEGGAAIELQELRDLRLNVLAGAGVTIERASQCRAHAANELLDDLKYVVPLQHALSPLPRSSIAPSRAGIPQEGLGSPNWVAEGGCRQKCRSRVGSVDAVNPNRLAVWVHDMHTWWA